MFKKFFSFIVAAISKYVKANGIVKTVCNAVQGAFAAAAAVVVGSKAFKQIKAKFTINWHLKKNRKHVDDVVFANDNNVPYAYDKNGYRMTTSEVYKHNKSEMKKIEKLYTDDNLDCVKMIEMHDPKRFKGMTQDQRLQYIVDNDITLNDLRYEFGLDKDTQVRMHLAEEMGIPVEQVTNEQVQAFWDEGESTKVGVGSKVKKGFTKPKSKKKKAKEDLINFYDPMMYYALEVDYSVQNYNNLKPEDISPDLYARRAKFDERMQYASAYLNLLYVHNRERFDKQLEFFGGNPNDLLRACFISFMENDEEFQDVKTNLGPQIAKLKSEAKGHRPSTRKPITNLEEADYVDMLETELDRLNDIKMKAKCNVPAGLDEDTDEDEDDDYDENFEDSDDLDHLGCESMKYTEDILDQLDALREGRDPFEKPDPQPEPEVAIIDDSPAKHQPVKLIQKFDSDDNGYRPDNDPSVLKIPTEKYTNEYRAQVLLDMYAELHKSSKQTADEQVGDAIVDENHYNFELYELSDEMKAQRQSDREHLLPFKLIRSDYATHEEAIAAGKQYVECSNTYGLAAWKNMLNDHMAKYYEKFEYDCIEFMLKNLVNHNMPQETKVDFIKLLNTLGYSNLIKSELALYPGLEDMYNEAVANPNPKPEVYNQVLILDDDEDWYATELPK